MADNAVNSMKLAEEFANAYVKILKIVESEGKQISCPDAARAALDILANTHDFKRVSPVAWESSNW